MENERRIIIGEEERLLPVLLSDEERAGYGRLLAEQVKTLMQAQDDKKRISKQLGDAIKEQEAQVAKTTRKVNTGTEDREVSCTLLQDINARVILTQRNDTYEIVDRRPMNAKELREALQLRMDAGT